MVLGWLHLNLGTPDHRHWRQGQGPVIRRQPQGALISLSHTILEAQGVYRPRCWLGFRLLLLLSIDIGDIVLVLPNIGIPRPLMNGRSPCRMSILRSTKVACLNCRKFVSMSHVGFDNYPCRMSLSFFSPISQM